MEEYIVPECEEFAIGEKLNEINEDDEECSNFSDAENAEDLFIDEKHVKVKSIALSQKMKTSEGLPEPMKLRFDNIDEYVDTVMCLAAYEDMHVENKALDQTMKDTMVRIINNEERLVEFELNGRNKMITRVAQKLEFTIVDKCLTSNAIVLEAPKCSDGRVVAKLSYKSLTTGFFSWLSDDCSEKAKCDIQWLHNDTVYRRISVAYETLSKLSGKNGNKARNEIPLPDINYESAASTTPCSETSSTSTATSRTLPICQTAKDFSIPLTYSRRGTHIEPTMNWSLLSKYSRALSTSETTIDSLTSSTSRRTGKYVELTMNWSLMEKYGRMLPSSEATIDPSLTTTSNRTLPSCQSTKDSTSSTSNIKLPSCQLTTDSTPSTSNRTSPSCQSTKDSTSSTSNIKLPSCQSTIDSTSSTSNRTIPSCQSTIDSTSSTSNRTSPSCQTTKVSSYKVPVEAMNPAAPQLSEQVREILIKGDESVYCNQKPFKCPPMYKQMNNQQMKASSLAMTHYVSLVKGPPGTGKTSTAVNIICSELKKKKKILVCAPSNIATDNLLARVSLEAPDYCVRLYSSMQDRVSKSAFQKFSIAGRMKETDNIKTYCPQDIRHMFEDSDASVNEADEKDTAHRRMERHKFQYKRDLLRYRYNVVFSTCCSAGDPSLRGTFFDVILIDEATQDPESTCFIPFMRADISAKIILIGDDKQLGPVMISAESRRLHADMSMFERLLKIGVPCEMLCMQYRMHPLICTLTNTIFYESKLVDGVTEADRSYLFVKNYWIDSSKPVAFIAVESVEETNQNSIFNQKEADIVINIVCDLVKNYGVKGNEIAVITAYSEQIRKLIVRLQLLVKTEKSASFKQEMSNVQVNTVNGYQGQEREFVIFSLCRSNESKTIGFLEDVRRLNVAITRAMYGLILVGNPLMFKNSKILQWRKLIEWFEKNKLIYDGYSQVNISEQIRRMQISSKVGRDNNILAEKCYETQLNNFTAASCKHLLPDCQHSNNQKFVYTKVIFETNDYTDFYVHSDFIGAVFGVGGVNIGAVGKKFRVSIEVTPVHLRKFDHVLCTIRGASRLTHRNALNDIETNIKEEFTCRQNLRKRFFYIEGMESICGKTHSPPLTDVALDEAFQVVQMRSGYIEFKIRHDIRGDLMAQNFIDNTLNEYQRVILVPFITKYMKENEKHQYEFYCVWSFGKSTCTMTNEETATYIRQHLKQQIQIRINKYFEKSNIRGGKKQNS